MHELSVVLGIVDLVDKELAKANRQAVESIELEIGTLAGVEPQALDYAWDEGVKNTVLAKAKRDINYLEGQAKCLECSTIFKVEQLYDSCPNCQSYFKDIIQGKELRVKSIIV